MNHLKKLLFIGGKFNPPSTDFTMPNAATHVGVFVQAVRGTLWVATGQAFRAGVVDAGGAGCRP